MAATLFEEFVLLFQMACVVFLVTYLFAKSRFFLPVLEHRANMATQVFLSIVFGLLSVYGMSSGISFYTATVNIRDFGPLAAGLACGPYVGLAAGIIGFIYRLGVGGTNVYAVAIGPLAAGIIGGMVWYFSKRELVPLRTAVIVTFVAESLISVLAIIVRISTGDPLTTWTTVTVNVAVPMILMTTLAVAVFSIILHNERRERGVESEKKQLELEVESKRNLSTIINTIPHPVYVLDRGHRFVLVNDRFCQFIRKSREDLLGRTPGIFFSRNDAEAHYELVEAVFRGEDRKEEETEQRLPDGHLHTLVTTPAQYTDAAGSGFMVGVIQDITERKKMEIGLAESEAWYRILFEHTGAATIIIDQDGIIGQVNSEFVELTGFSRDEITGRMKWKEIVHEDDLERTRRFHNKRLADPASAPTHYTVRIRNRSGNVRTLHAMVVVIPGTTQSIASYVDISEQKRTEEALRLANRKLNLLSSITRHDIINQILILKGYLSLLRSKTETPALLDFIGKSYRATENIERQIVFTRDYQDMGVKEPAWQNVRDSITEAKGALPISAVTIDAEQADLEVFADPLFEKVFFNLMDNSLRYGGEGMRTIRVLSKKNGDGLLLTYEDDGVGIAPNDRGRLFEQGFGRHTGFGLFLSREILSITGITIEENGTPGCGARFSIRVPHGAYRFPQESRAGSP